MNALKSVARTQRVKLAGQTLNQHLLNVSWTPGDSEVDTVFVAKLNPQAIPDVSHTFMLLAFTASKKEITLTQCCFNFGSVS